MRALRLNRAQLVGFLCYALALSLFTDLVVLCMLAWQAYCTTKAFLLHSVLRQHALRADDKLCRQVAVSADLFLCTCSHKPERGSEICLLGAQPGVQPDHELPCRCG